MWCRETACFMTDGERERERERGKVREGKGRERERERTKPHHLKFLSSPN
jgi:hypothetical protein